MPYINKTLRPALDPTIYGELGVAQTPGELNFIITRICADYLKRKGVSYANISEVISQLECAKLEFYRRIAAPYEDQKCKENGDVY